MSKRRGKAIQIEWNESADELHGQFKNEKDRQIKTRLQVMWLLRCGKTQSAASELAGVSSRTVRRWVAWYREGGLDLLRGRLHGKQGGGKSWLNPDQMAALKTEIDTGRFHTALEINEWVKEQWNIEYQGKSIYNVLGRIKARKKVPRRQSDKADPTLQEAWKKGA